MAEEAATFRRQRLGRLDREDDGHAGCEAEVRYRLRGDVGAEPPARTVIRPIWGSRSLMVTSRALRGLPPGVSRKTETAWGENTATTGSPDWGVGSLT